MKEEGVEDQDKKEEEEEEDEVEEEEERKEDHKKNDSHTHYAPVSPDPIPPSCDRKFHRAQTCRTTFWQC